MLTNNPSTNQATNTAARGQQQADGAKPNADADIAAGLKAAANPAPTTEQKPATTQEGQQTPAEELRSLRDRLATLESEQQVREEKRRAEDTVDSFIRADKLPAELMRRFLPKTADKDVLIAERNKLGEMLREVMDGMVAAGRMKWIDLGGATKDGGETPASAKPTAVQGTAVENIASGLNTVK